MLLPAGFPAAVNSAHIAAREDRWPRYAQDAHIVHGVLAHEVRVASGWSSKSILQAFIANGFEAVTDSRGQATRFELTASGAIESVKERRHASRVLSVLGDLGSTQAQAAVLAAMGLHFSFPKPLALVEYLLSLFDERDAIVLDCFAGSGTTAHAVMAMNARDGGQRRWSGGNGWGDCPPGDGRASASGHGRLPRCARCVGLPASAVDFSIVVQSGRCELIRTFDVLLISWVGLTPHKDVCR